MNAATSHQPDDTTIRRRRFFQVQRSLVRRVGAFAFVAGIAIGALVAMISMLVTTNG